MSSRLVDYHKSHLELLGTLGSGSVRELHGDHVTGRETKRRPVGTRHTDFASVTGDVNVGQSILKLILASRVAVGGVTDGDVVDIPDRTPGDDTAGQRVVDARSLLVALTGADLRYEGVGASVGREESGSYALVALRADLVTHLMACHRRLFDEQPGRMPAQPREEQQRR